MGNQQSTSTQEQKNITKAVNEIMNNMTSDTSNSAEAKTTVVQSVTIVCTGLNIASPVTVDQSQQVTLSAKVSQMANEDFDVSQSSTTDISNQLKQAAEQSNSGQTVGSQSNQSSQKSLSDTEVKTLIKNTISKTVKNSTKVDAEGKQKVEIELRSANIFSPITVNQEQVFKLLAETAATNILKAYADQTGSTSLKTQMDNSSSQSNAGLSLISPEIISGCLLCCCAYVIACFIARKLSII